MSRVVSYKRLKGGELAVSSATYVDSILPLPKDPALQRRLDSREMGRSCQRLCGCLSEEIDGVIIKLLSKDLLT